MTEMPEQQLKIAGSMNSLKIEQDSKGIYPELIGKAPTSISVMQKGYLFDLDTDLGQYEIQCKLEYEQEV